MFTTSLASFVSNPKLTEQSKPSSVATYCCLYATFFLSAVQANTQLQPNTLQLLLKHQLLTKAKKRLARVQSCPVKSENDCDGAAGSKSRARVLAVFSLFGFDKKAIGKSIDHTEILQS